MDAELKASDAPEKPHIPKILIEATEEAIRNGMKPDELAHAIEKMQKETGGKKRRGGRGMEARIREMKKARAKRDGGRHDSEEEEDVQPRHFRNLDERRLGILISSGQRQIGDSEGKDEYIHPHAVPLDYSFCMINKIEEVVLEGEEPQSARQGKQPDKTPDGRYRTSSLMLSYNVIDSFDGLVNVMYKVLDGGPLGLCWLDISFNTISKLDEETLDQVPNLKILHLHANSINDMTEIRKLKMLNFLMELTLHGNPIEEEEGYRVAVLYYLPRLKHLDFVGVTRKDLEKSMLLAPRYEPFWQRRQREIHLRLLASKQAKESLTQRLMTGDEPISDDGED